jgi:hypothetical protein
MKCVKLKADLASTKSANAAKIIHIAQEVLVRQEYHIAVTD